MTDQEALTRKNSYKCIDLKPSVKATTLADIWGCNFDIPCRISCNRRGKMLLGEFREEEGIRTRSMFTPNQ